MWADAPQFKLDIYHLRGVHTSQTTERRLWRIKSAKCLLRRPKGRRCFCRLVEPQPMLWVSPVFHRTMTRSPDGPIPRSF
jgi:hypothetical protein